MHAAVHPTDIPLPPSAGLPLPFPPRGVGTRGPIAVTDLLGIGGGSDEPPPAAQAPVAVEAPPVTEATHVTVIIPAHNEAVILADTIASVQNQTRSVDRILVVADNCSDDTVAVARAAGVEVMETVDNTARKAGALNQALATCLPSLDDAAGNTVVCMDADTTLAPGFVERALTEMNTRPDVAAVGAVCRVNGNHSLIQRFQILEYARNARTLARRKGRAHILSGTATMFRPEALADVAAARQDGRLPPGSDVYSTASITEDHELTLALKHLGWDCTCPMECTVTTEIMPTWRKLWNQRLRWYRGAYEDILTYGVSRVTLPYLLRMGLVMLSLCATIAFLLGWVWTLTVAEPQAINWWWCAVPLIIVPERVLTVRRCRPSNMLLAALVVPEILYSWWQLAIYVKAWWQGAWGSDTEWQPT